MADTCHYCWHIASDTRYVTDGQTEAYEASRIEQMDVLQVEGVARYFLLVFMGAAKVRVGAELIITLVGWGFIAIAPEGDVMCKFGEFQPLCRVNKVASTSDRKIELENIIIYLSDDAIALVVSRFPRCG